MNERRIELIHLSINDQLTVEERDDLERASLEVVQRTFPVLLREEIDQLKRILREQYSK